MTKNTKHHIHKRDWLPTSQQFILSYLAAGYILYRKAGLDGCFWLKKKGRKGEREVANAVGVALITKKYVREIKSRWDTKEAAWIITHEITEAGRKALEETDGM